MGVGSSRQGKNAWFHLARTLFVGGVLPLAGCATWDDLTSNSFWDDPVTVVFHQPEPMEVLRSPESTGDQLARAMAKVNEPLRSGGSQAEQDELLGILGRHATRDDRVLVRMAAIETLGRFHDPRAVDHLMTTYQMTSPTRSSKPQESGDAETLRFTKLAGDTRIQMTIDDPTESLFPDSDPNSLRPDDAAELRCRALAGLARHRSQSALPILVELASGKGAASEVTDEIHRRELRLVAIRGLSHYPAERQAAAPLVSVLRSEADVALRGAAHDGLVKITGVEEVTDADAWQAVLESPTPLKPRSSSTNVISQVGRWIGVD